MRLVIIGDPIPKLRARHKILKTKKFVSKNMPKLMSYDPQNDEKKRVTELMVRARSEYALSDKAEMQEILDAPALIVFMTFYFRPAYTSQADYNRKLWNLESHNKKPDIDNLAKFYLDCGKGVIWQDDNMVSSLYARKTYNDIPQTEIFITPKDPLQLPQNSKIILECFSPSELQKFLEDAKNLGDLLNINPCGENFEKSLSFVTTKIAEFAATYADQIKKVKKHITKK